MRVFFRGTLMLTAVLVACAIAAVFYQLSRSIDRATNKADCRNVALRAVEIGVSTDNLSRIRNACLDVMHKKR
jgi:hypothetical protein